MLPPGASLRYLKTDTKDCLKAHKQGSTSVCRLLRNLPRFSQATDQQILSSKVTLQEVQFALARDYGYRSWTELVSHIESQRRPSEVATATTGRALLPNAGSFENSDSTLSHLRSIRYVLEYHGEAVDWDWLMGVSGEAFCYYFHPVGTYLTQHVHSWDVANAALEAHGYAGRWTTPAFTNDVAELLAPFRTEIAKGNPVIAPGIVPHLDGIHSRCDHWYTVVGVDMAAGKVIVAGHGQDLSETVLPTGDAGPDGPHPCWYGIIRTFAPGSNGHYGPDRPLFVTRRTGQPRARAVVAADAVKQGVALAKEESTCAIAGWGRGTYLAGHKALRALRDTVAKAEGDGLAEFQNRNPTGEEPFRGFADELEFLRLLSDRRRSAAGFLEQARELWQDAESRRLSSAAEHFRQSSREALAAFNVRYGNLEEHDRVKRMSAEASAQDAGNPVWNAYWARADAALADKQKRQEMVAHLDQVLKHESAAVAEIESVLPSLR